MDWPSFVAGYVSAWMTGPVLLCLTMGLGYVIGRVRRRQQARVVFTTARDPEAEVYETEEEREIHETFGPLVEAQLRTIPRERKG